MLAARDRFVGDLQRLPSHALAHGRHHAARALDHAAAAARRLSSSPSFPHYVAGITAGVLECVVGHPLDTIRVRIITAGTHPGAGVPGVVNSAKATCDTIAADFHVADFHVVTG